MLSHPRPRLDIPPHDLSVHQGPAQPALYHVPPHSIPQNSIHHHPFPIPAPHIDPRLPLDTPHDLHHPPQNQTCVPALIPPGMDPSQVDIRTFYPYTPNEVKHRKRTTRAQLKVLEGVYKYDTKPNASLRKKLAAELDMTPRGVQVWFQNRRAKTKQQAKKAEAAAATGSSKPTVVDGLAGTSPSNPPIAPRPEADGDDDHKELDEDLLSQAPPSPQPPSEETAPEDGDRLPPVSSDALNSNVNENLNSTPDSRRGSIAPSHSLPSWATNSPSASSPVSAPQPATAPTSANASPTSAGHVNAHIRLSTHPPSATAYSNNHLAPPDVYAQRRTSLPVASLSPHAALRLGQAQKRGFDPSRRRLSSDMSGHGGHRMLAHPYMHVATTANGGNAYNEGNDGAHHPPMRRPQLMARMSAPFPPGAHQNHLHPGHPHLMPVVPSQSHPQLPTQRSYDVSGMPASPQAMYGQGPPLGYDPLAPRHSIDGSALGLMQAHQHMNLGMQQQMNGGYSMDMNVGPLDQPTYVISQRPYAPPVPGPLPSPNFSFGNPFGPSSSSNSSSNSASGTPPNGASPPLLSLPRRPSEGGASDADTEESSAGPLSRFGSVASLGGGSEVSWTSAYTSEGGLVEGGTEEGNICASRRESSASGHFLELFSDLEVGSNGGTPAPPSLHEQQQQQQQQLRHAASSSHLSPSNYPAHHIQVHSPDTQVAQTPAEGDDGYPSPSSASTISAGSTHSHQHCAHDTANQHAHVVNGNGNMVGHGHSRTNNTSSELAFALQDAPAKTDMGQLQFPGYRPGGSETIANEHGYPQYAQEQAHHPHPDYAKGQGHFPTVYEGYVYPSSGDGQIAAGNEAYAAGAIELSHMCVPASEGVHFIGGYMQYS